VGINNSNPNLKSPSKVDVNKTKKRKVCVDYSPLNI